MDLALLSADGGPFLIRWIHLLAGVTWIGLLYYFNFVHVPFMGQAGTEPGRPIATRFLLPRALWWFRWGAVFTFVSGLLYMGHKIGTGGGAVMSSSWGVNISIGGLLGTLMFLNVWLVIWPNQQVVMASAEAVAAGGQADPKAAGSAARAFLASRTNTLFSIPMLFFMAAASHLGTVASGESKHVAMGICTAIILLLEANVLVGTRNQGPSKMLEKHVGVIHVGLVLALALYLVIDLV